MFVTGASYIHIIYQNLGVGSYPEECLNCPNIPVQAPTLDPTGATELTCIVVLPVLCSLAK